MHGEMERALSKPVHASLAILTRKKGKMKDAFQSQEKQFCLQELIDYL
jgi:hypothetical protein